MIKQQFRKSRRALAGFTGYFYSAIKDAKIGDKFRVPHSLLERGFWGKAANPSVTRALESAQGCVRRCTDTSGLHLLCLFWDISWIMLKSLFGPMLFLEITTPKCRQGLQEPELVLGGSLNSVQDGQEMLSYLLSTTCTSCRSGIGRSGTTQEFCSAAEGQILITDIPVYPFMAMECGRGPKTHEVPKGTIQLCELLRCSREWNSLLQDLGWVLITGD